METTSLSPGVKTAKVYSAILSHTHWDREWYLPFQAFRLKLADLVDQLLDILETNPDFRYFMLDGQTVVLEDYLQLRPEFRERLARHIQSGRVLVGPWYVLPDEFLVSGESLIRNLLTGHRMAREFGSPMKVGYLPDCFGHIAEIPQILRGFGIDSAVIWRGVADDVEANEFIWRAPDGSEVMTLHLPFGYFNAHRLPEDLQQFLSRIDVIRNQLESRTTTPYLVLMNGSDHAFPEGEVPKFISEANEILPDLELFHTNLNELVKSIKEYARENDTHWRTVVGELRDSKRAPLLPGVLSTRMWIKQRNFECESLLEKWAEPLTAWSALTERFEAAAKKSGNGHFERVTRGMELPAGYRHTAALRQAWRYILQNHPHDSICGCSVDQVHEEMKVRFDWSEQIANSLIDSSSQRLLASIDTESVWSADSPSENIDRAAIVVLNPVVGPRTDFVRTWVPVPATRGFKLVDELGQERPYQIIERRHAPLISADATRASLLALFNGVGYPDEVEWSEETLRFLEKAIMGMGGEESSQFLIARMDIKPAIRACWTVVDIDALDVGERQCMSIREAIGYLARVVRDNEELVLFQFRIRRSDQLELGFVAEGVPGHGYRTYQLIADGKPTVRSGEAAADHIENEHLLVEVDPKNGTLTVTDKETGEAYEGLNHFVDGGDCGDEYNYAPPEFDSVIASPISPPVLELVESGAACSTLKIELTYDVPAALSPTRRSRISPRVRLSISSYISLYAGVKRVDVRTVVDNQAGDHRLRVHFPAGIVAEKSFAEGHFGVIERSTEIQPSTPDWAEDAVGTFPQKRFVDVHNGSRGLTIANRGLPEYEIVSSERESVIVLTLLRNVGWLSRDDLKLRRGHAGPGLETPGAQCIGTHVFEYAIIPHGSTWRESFEQALGFSHSMKAVTTDVHRGLMASVGSFVEVAPRELVVSAVKLPEEGEGLIVRLYNITKDGLQGSLHLPWPFERAGLVDLEERFVAHLPVRGNSVKLSLGPSEMVTVRFSF